MELQELYTYAKNLANKIKQEKPAYASEQGASLCLIELDTQEIISGVSCISIRQDAVVTFSAEHVAVVSMVAAGHKKAKRVIILSLEDGSIMQPEEASLHILMQLDSENADCAFVTETDKTMTIAELTAPPPPPVDFFSGFGDEDAEAAEGSTVFDGGFDESYTAPQHAPVKPEVTAPEQPGSLGAPAEFASSVTVDESNPFNSPSAAESAPVTIAGTPGSAPAMTGNPAAAASRDAELTPEELLKKAKKKKKIAKSNFRFFQ